MTSSPETAPSNWQAEGSAGRVAMGAAWSTGASLVLLAGGFALTLTLVRGLSTTTYGALAIGSAVTGILTAVGGMGLGPAVSRFGIGSSIDGEFRSPTRAADHAFAAALPGAAILVAISLLIGFGMLASDSLHGAGLVVLALSPLAALTPYQSVIAGFLVATFRPRLASGTQIAQTLLQLGLILVVVGLGTVSAYQVALIRMAVGVAAFGYLLWRLKLAKSARPARSEKSIERAELVRFGWAMTLTTMAGIAISQLDVLILGLARGARPAGLYAPVSRLADTALLLPNAVGAYLLPAVAASMFHDDDRTPASHYHWASRWALVFATPAVAALLLTPSALLHVLFGVQNHSLVAPARVLAAGLLIHLFFGFNGMTLDALGDARLVAVRSGYGVALSAVACAVLVPLLGTLGAALATSMAILGLNSLCSVMLMRRHRIPMWDLHMAAVVGAVGVGLLLGWALVATVDTNEYAAIISVTAVSTAPALAVSIAFDWPAIRHRLQRSSSAGAAAQ